MSEIITDKLTGKATAKTVTITVGATLTQSLQTGLVTTFGGFNQHSSITSFNVPPLTGITESLNVSSYTDVSTGKAEADFTSNTANNDRPIFGQVKNTNNVACPDTDVTATNKMRMTINDGDSSAAQDNLFWFEVLGGMA